MSPGVGLDLFEAAHARLGALGLRERDPHGAAASVARLADALTAMAGHRGPTFGKVALVDGGGTSRGTSCEAAAFDFARRCLAEAAARDRRIADAHDRLEQRLRELLAAVRPRAEYAVVHGELGFDHVLLDRDGNPVLIDVEDLMYFDVEWEHVFLRLRHPAEYSRPLAVEGLDEDRLALYTLTQRLSLTAGPLRLLEGDFADREFMRAVAAHHSAEALTLVATD